MGLIDLIRKNKNVKATTRQPDNAGTIARIATVAVANPKEEKNANDADIEKIREWLYRIGEDENDHFLVIDRCKRDPQALIYFSRHALGESGYSVTTEADVDDRVKCSDCRFLLQGYCQQWRQVNPHVQRYRPEQTTPKRCAHFKQK